MMRFNVNGQYLELPADFSLQFKKSNVLFAFDNMECERSTSFDIPATPQNDRIFKLAKWIQAPGTGMRRRYYAQMQASVVTKNGYLYVDAYAKGNYKAIFVTGELLGLKQIRDAGKLSDLAIFNDTVAWTAGLVPDLPNRSTDNWNIVKYSQAGGFPHPSWLIKYVVDTIVAANNLPAINIPASGQCLRVITGVPKLLKPTDVSFARSIESGNWVDVTQTYPYPRITTLGIQSSAGDLSGLFTLADYDVQYRRHWEDYDFQTMQPVVRTVTYAGNVQHLVTTQKVKITFSRDFPADTYIGTFYDNGEYTGGFGFFGDRSFGKYWNGKQSVTTRKGEPLAGRTVVLEAGSSFVFVRESDLLDYTQYTDNLTTHETWEQGWKNVRSAFDVTGVTIEGDGDAVVGNIVRLQDNLPDITLVDLLKAVAALTGKVLNYTDEKGITFDDLDTDTWQTKELAGVISIDTVNRKFGDYAQRNTLHFDSDNSVAQSARVIEAYVIDNDNLEASKDLQTVPFSEGGVNYEGAVEIVAVAEDNGKDTVADAATSVTSMARASLPINENLQNLCGASTGVTIKARMSLLEYNNIGAKTRIYYDGVRYVWTEAQWSKDVATFKLSKTQYSVLRRSICLAV